jgi:chromosome segregation ATPase
MMKSKLITFSLVVFMVAGILCACNSPKNKAEATQESKDSLTQAANTAADTVNTAKADWEKFRTEASDKIKQNEDSITSFKVRIKNKDAKIKAKYNKVIARIEKKNNELKAKLEAYKAETREELEKFKSDFNNSMDTLDADINHMFKGKKKKHSR